MGIEEEVIFGEEMRKSRGRKTKGSKEISECDLFSVTRCLVRNGGEAVS